MLQFESKHYICQDILYHLLNYFFSYEFVNIGFPKITSKKYRMGQIVKIGKVIIV